MSDALKWGALGREDRAKISLHGVAKYFKNEPANIEEDTVVKLILWWRCNIAGALDSTLTSVKQMVRRNVPALGKEHVLTHVKSGHSQEPPHMAESVKSDARKLSITSIASRIKVPAHLNVPFVEGS
ncbi:hypothetical protein HYALB_00008152 [Hymenoscyphus albidus]|uniref:Uncharacterized protein n=1 Tax=Hymenoscyphus albidus TaxID=595503 RepID=A0A9N9QE13_9HELO|nr:hypothetical protein HYALB_00008152 [Hymenoscyphus albidus]